MREMPVEKRTNLRRWARISYLFHFLLFPEKIMTRCAFVYGGVSKHKQVRSLGKRGALLLVGAGGLFFFFVFLPDINVFAF